MKRVTNANKADNSNYMFARIMPLFGLTSHSQVLTPACGALFVASLWRKVIENIVERVENARNQHFHLFFAVFFVFSKKYPYL